MANQRFYQAPGLDLAVLADAMTQWFQSQEFEAQTLPTPGGLTLQARHQKFFHQSQALTATFIQQGDTLTAQVGTGKWAMHALNNVAAAIIFWPLLAWSGYEAYKQKELIDEAVQWVDQYIASVGGTRAMAGPAVGMMGATAAPMAAAAPAAKMVPCPNCGKPVREGAKFCAECGAKLVVTCAQCGATLRADSKFCDACGAKVEAA